MSASACWTGALQFKEEYEKAMAANEKLLAADDAGEEDEGDAAGADSSAQVLDLTDALGKVRHYMQQHQMYMGYMMMPR